MQLEQSGPHISMSKLMCNFIIKSNFVEISTQIEKVPIWMIEKKNYLIFFNQNFQLLNIWDTNRTANNIKRKANQKQSNWNVQTQWHPAFIREQLGKTVKLSDSNISTFYYCYSTETQQGYVSFSFHVSGFVSSSLIWNFSKESPRQNKEQ